MSLLDHGRPANVRNSRSSKLEVTVIITALAVINVIIVFRCSGVSSSGNGNGHCSSF